MPFFAAGQVKKKCWKVRHVLPEGYSKADAELDFQMAIQNIDRDTTIEHKRHKNFITAISRKVGRLQDVYRFDSTSTIGQKAKGMLDSLLKIHVQQLQKSWFGNWQWAWSGWTGLVDDDGEFETDGIFKKSMLVTADSILIFKNDTLESKKPYQLSIGYWSIGQDFFSAQVGEECWTFEISTKTDQWRIKTKAKQFLDIGRWQGCACGCPRDVFYRKE